MKRVLVTGATGYPGGRLLPELEQAGYRVRCLVRQPEQLIDRVGPQTQVGIYPLHSLVFSGMLRGIARSALAVPAPAEAPPADVRHQRAA